ncbi:MAG TPA: hypothetical protein VIF15_10290 [Polyangiaceae bacterium]|jgi:hypothetical protein
MAWEKTIRTGDRSADVRALEQARAQGRAQGLVVQANPLPGGGGGWHVRALLPSALRTRAQ